MAQEKHSPHMRARALDALQECLDARLDIQGGYPAVVDGDTIPGYVLVADVDHDEAPTLTVYHWPQLLAWHRAAKRYLRKNPEANIVEAMNETADQIEGLEA